MDTHITCRSNPFIESVFRCLPFRFARPCPHDRLGRMTACRKAAPGGSSPSARCFAFRITVPVLLLLTAFAGAGAAQADENDADTAVEWKGAYAGVFVGSGRAANRIIDIDGFANWGNPGWAVKYDA